MAMEIAIKQPERLLLSGEMLAAGTFRCAAGDPLFEDSGPCSGNVIVFPRRVVEITFRHGPSFIGDPTSMVMYNRGQRYRRRAISSADHSDWIALSDDLLQELSEWSGGTMLPARPFRRPQVASPASLFLRQRLLFESLLHPDEHDGHQDAGVVEEIALQIVADATAMVGPLRQEKRADDPRVRRAKEQIAATLGANLSLGEIARDAGISPFRMCRLFKAVTGTTLGGFRSDLRLRLALQLLSRPSADILEIAVRLGFSSHSHFTSRFVQHFGLTPRQFRSSAGRSSCVPAGAGKGRDMPQPTSATL